MARCQGALRAATNADFVMVTNIGTDKRSDLIRCMHGVFSAPSTSEALPALCTKCNPPGHTRDTQSPCKNVQTCHSGQPASQRDTHKCALRAPTPASAPEAREVTGAYSRKLTGGWGSDRSNSPEPTALPESSPAECSVLLSVARACTHTRGHERARCRQRRLCMQCAGPCRSHGAGLATTALRHGVSFIRSLATIAVQQGAADVRPQCRSTCGRHDASDVRPQCRSRAAHAGGGRRAKAKRVDNACAEHSRQRVAARGGAGGASPGGEAVTVRCGGAGCGQARGEHVAAVAALPWRRGWLRRVQGGRHRGGRQGNHVWREQGPGRRRRHVRGKESAWLRAWSLGVWRQRSCGTEIASEGVTRAAEREVRHGRAVLTGREATGGNGAPGACEARARRSEF
jgi:hypothetical protein